MPDAVRSTARPHEDGPRDDDPPSPPPAARRGATAPRRARPRCGRVLVVGLVIAVVLAAVAIIWRWAWAWVPAVLAAIIFVVAIAMDRLDRRVRREPPLPDMSETQRERVTRTEAWAVGSETTFVILGGLAAIALVLASVFLEWPLVALGGLLVFGWCALLGMPVWLAAVADEEEIERERLTGEPAPTSHGDRGPTGGAARGRAAPPEAAASANAPPR